MLPFLHTLLAHPIIPIFLVANLAIGFWAHRKAKVNSFEDYALASRSLPTGVLVFSLLATVLDREYLAEPSWTYYQGVLNSFYLIPFLFSFLLIGTFIAPYLVYFNGSITIGDLMELFYGHIARFLTGLVSCVISIFIITAQIRAIGRISQELLGIDSTIAIVAISSMVVLYSIFGGMRAVSYTDILQAIGALVAISLITSALLQKLGGSYLVLKKLSNHHPSKLSVISHPNIYNKVKAVIFWTVSGTMLFSPPIVQRMLVAQDKKKVRRMWYAGAGLHGIICLMITVIGLGAIVGKEALGIDDTTTDILLKVINSLFDTHSWIGDCIFIGLLGILLSSMDSFLHAVGISLSRDVVNPVKQWYNSSHLDDKQMIRCSKVAIGLVGSFSIFCGFILGDFSLSFASSWLYDYTVILSGLIVFPLVFGILGIKTDKILWVSFSITYLLCLSVAFFLKWSPNDSYILSMPLATLAYFLAHIIQNRGIVTLKRSELTVAERLWLPSWSGLRKKVIGFVKAPLHLPTLADRKVVSTPMHSLAFSMLIFALYTLSSIFSSGGLGTANFMAGIHFVGITLCCGLMLKGIWPARLKPYFPLYWFVSLFYCLPFGGTLSVLQSHAGVAEASLWVAKIVFLAFLVDSSSFLVIAFLGTALPCLGWYLFTGGLPQDIWSDSMLMAFAVLLALFLGILLFGRGKEARTSERLYWNRIASSILGHDLRGSTQMLGGAGNILEKTFEIGEPSTNGKGEKGYWLPFAQSQFLAQFSGDMTKKAASTRKEISNFLAFIQHQIMGTFEQKAVSMHAMAEEGMEKIAAKVKSSRIKLTLEAPTDFKAKVLAGIFPNVIFNLLMNATTHGKASEVTITIDGNTRTITVRDNGKGITADVLPRIFDLSYSSARHGKENAGVGLAFAKMVLDASGGKIVCHSRAGEGSFTEFVMTFEEG